MEPMTIPDIWDGTYDNTGHLGLHLSATSRVENFTMQDIQDIWDGIYDNTGHLGWNL